MTAGPGPASQPQPAGPVEMGGRIRELQREVAESSARRAILAGENANLIDLLRASDEEIKRLRAEVERLTPAPAAGPAEDTAQTVQ